MRTEPKETARKGVDTAYTSIQKSIMSEDDRMFEPERRDLSHVPRWAILRLLHQQSVAEHSFFACCYGLEIADVLGWPKDGDAGTARYLLALYLLRHDEVEVVESDITGPVKRLSKYDGGPVRKLVSKRLGKTPEPDADMLAIRRTADLVDECMHLAGEVAMGNRTVKAVLDNCYLLLAKSVAELPGNLRAKDTLLVTLQESIRDQATYTKSTDGLTGV